ncbi:MAG: TMEM14 family protein [Acidobacteria bacterium]|nr:TMEM14 family protein [Acidobacteriota bacterium]
MDIASIILLAYGAVVLGGGLMGWVKARSTPSLVAGLAFGVALIVDAFLFTAQPYIAAVLALVLPGLLAAIMGVRFAKSKKFMPAGMIAALSLVVLVLLWLTMPSLKM